MARPATREWISGWDGVEGCYFIAGIEHPYRDEGSPHGLSVTSAEDARLIAAAPTLLEALREVVAEWDTRADALPMGYMQRDTGGIELARVAIRLAEGEE